MENFAEKLSLPRNGFSNISVEIDGSARPDVKREVASKTLASGVNSNLPTMHLRQLSRDKQAEARSAIVYVCLR